MSGESAARDGMKKPIHPPSRKWTHTFKCMLCGDEFRVTFDGPQAMLAHPYCGKCRRKKEVKGK